MQSFNLFIIAYFAETVLTKLDEFEVKLMATKAEILAAVENLEAKVNENSAKLSQTGAAIQSEASEIKALVEEIKAQLPVDSSEDMALLLSRLTGIGDRLSTQGDTITSATEAIMNISSVLTQSTTPVVEE